MLKDRASDIGLLILLCPEVQPCSVWTALPFPVRHISHQMCLSGSRMGSALDAVDCWEVGPESCPSTFYIRHIWPPGFGQVRQLDESQSLHKTGLKSVSSDCSSIHTLGDTRKRHRVPHCLL